MICFFPLTVSSEEPFGVSAHAFDVKSSTAEGKPCTCRITFNRFHQRLELISNLFVRGKRPHTDRHTDTQTDRQTDRQTHTHTHTHTHAHTHARTHARTTPPPTHTHTHRATTTGTCLYHSETILLGTINNAKVM